MLLCRGTIFQGLGGDYKWKEEDKLGGYYSNPGKA